MSNSDRPPPDTLSLPGDLTLASYDQVLLTFSRKVIVGFGNNQTDEWQLKEFLVRLLKIHANLRISDDDLIIRKGLKEGSIVSTMCVNIWDGTAKALDVQSKMQALDVSVGGVRLQCAASCQPKRDIESVCKEWEAKYGTSADGYASRQPGHRPDTVVIEGLPSRWFANPTVSSTSPSPLVAHEVFSHFGPLRQLDIVSGEGGLRKAIASADKGALATSLECKVVLQYENYEGFCAAFKALCNKVMLKAGSKKFVPVIVSWDKDGYFSESAIRRRKFAKQQEERAEQQRLAEEARRKAREARKAEMERRAEEKRLREEQEERERQAAEEAERLRQEEEEMRLRLEEEARLEEERLRREEEEERIREELRLQREEQERAREERRRQEEAAEEERIQQELRTAAEAAERAAEEERARRKRKEEERELRERGDVEKRLRSELLKRQRDAGRSRARQPVAEQGHDREMERWSLDDTKSAASIHVQEDLDEAARRLSSASEHGGRGWRPNDKSIERRIRSMVQG